ncbi:hypothetical protein [Deinococcus sp.]|uniref:hypothetical protein n=1 Tax=Deinococcus sp. TaxID=47478 RepID=UPI0028698C63|nr:hypothetical protein [Deinococcus sp.]
MGRLDDLQAQLQAAGLLVLRPEQLHEPAEAAPLDTQGRPVVGGGLMGLARYFEQHPAGYVQLQDPAGLLALGALDLSLLTIECLAPDSDRADALALAIKRAIRNHGVRPTPYTFATARTERSPNLVRHLLTFEVREPGTGV